ncbi:MAG TPA: DNA-3-methyladenine glycosylase, partial [Agromyces sp.]|nr:DNA-3-methyladenine glycosylase [Agromyces sp.]
MPRGGGTTGEATHVAELVRPDRAWFRRDAVELAPLLLGAVLSYDAEEGRVAVRLSEVEAYRGVGV